MYYDIHLNASGTHTLEITEDNLQTIRKYALFRHLVDSNGIVDESVLTKLKYNIRSLIANSDGKATDLLDLCIDVIYHSKMKAYGLQQLINVYKQWEALQDEPEEPDDTDPQPVPAQ
ncbi:MAG: hypothetical protein PUH21_00465 [Prevotellaceae bacterium]|nr:hypothetical protein [Prevotellaceae bacterium]MDY3856881.1 hypothetical protein [Bacteroidaceae bacterium]